jgi:DNA-binding GntR family transcriptional regulator
LNEIAGTAAHAAAYECMLPALKNRGSPHIVQSDVYDKLRAEIVAGDFEAGAPLAEAALAARYGTSRTPVREALRRLEQDGLVERGDRGMRVRTRSPEEILEIYEVRIPLEATAAAAAAQRRTEFDLIRIRRAHAAMDATADTAPAGMAAANRAAHEAIWAAGHNGTLVDLLTRLNNHLSRYPATTLALPGRREEARKEHEAIIQAIADRDAERAAELARNHMSRARELRLQIWASEGLD